MRIVRFVFSFLYVRDWHTGEMEVSKPRLMLFGGMLTIIFLAVVFALILQTPTVYNAT